ncbi:MAG: carbonic anhydrase [Ectothiorhodospira sp.]
MEKTSEDTPVLVEQDRRRFLQLAALGAGASLLATTSWVPEARAAGETEALLLTCMDFRLMDEIERYMTYRGLRNKYDHMILAGASLGALTERYPAWNKTFWQHLEISIQLHHIHRVILLDHRDCGAYKTFLGDSHTETPEREAETHAKYLKELARQIRMKQPELEVETLLMDLKGEVEAVG